MGFAALNPSYAFWQDIKQDVDGRDKSGHEERNSMLLQSGALAHGLPAVELARHEGAELLRRRALHDHAGLGEALAHDGFGESGRTTMRNPAVATCATGSKAVRVS